MTRDERLHERLKSDFDFLVNEGYEVLGVFLQGSQNYHLDYAGSDIDTKAIVIPSFEDFILNKKPVSTTHVHVTDEHLDIKDIRLMHECFKKQNINFIEILFTEYKYINSEYRELYQPMFDNAEHIAHYNNYAAVNCIAGMVYEKYKALEHPYPATMDKITKYGFDPKQLHHMIRCEEFLERYIAGVTYRDCLIPTEPEKLINIKANCKLSLQEARELAHNTDNHVKDVKDLYMQTHEVVINKTAETVMNNTLVNVCKHRFAKEITSDKLI